MAISQLNLSIGSIFIVPVIHGTRNISILMGFTVLVITTGVMKVISLDYIRKPTMANRSISTMVWHHLDLRPKERKCLMDLNSHLVLSYGGELIRPCC